MWNTDLVKMQQYYEPLVTLSEVTLERDRETENLNTVDILSIQE
jgi:hypothetical protein